MRCADDAVLWQAAEGDLSAEVELQDHLQGCPSCSERLASVRTTRAVLQNAMGASPRVDWTRTDKAVLGAAAEALSRRPWWRLASLEWKVGAVGALAALVLAVWVGVNPGGPIAGSEEVGEEAPVIAVQSTVESAEDAHVTERTSPEESLLAGESLKEGARVRTAQKGSAILRLPDTSRARLGAGSTATVRRARPDDVGLELEAGELVVQAAHVPRQAFLVDVGVAQVRVVGTAFRVNRSGEGIEVSVAEGKVQVEPREGETRMLVAGERAVLDAKGAWVRTTALDGEDGRAFEALGVHVEVAVPKAAVPTVAERPVPPRETKKKATRVPPRGSALAEAVQDEGPPAHEEWATPEFKKGPIAAARAPGLAERAKASGLPVTAEGLFLQRAGESLKQGRCGSFLPGLQDVVEVSEDVAARERARILKARCHDERLEPILAEREYRKYLEDFPRGRHAAEARRAVEGP